MNTKEKYEYCLGITKDCIEKLEILDEKGKILLEWINNYYKDAEHYYTQGDEATALEAIAYAHGFIDAGVLLGHFKIENYHLKEELKWFQYSEKVSWS